MNPTEFAATIRKKYPGSYDAIDDVTLSKKIVEKYPQYAEKISFDSEAPKKIGIPGKAYEALNIPSQLSRKGLGMIAEAVPAVEPTGNVVRDVALNYPKIMTEAVAEVAPKFVDRASLLTAGVLGTARAATPLIKGAGGLVGKGLEALSGLEHQTPGVLKEAAKDATLFFSRGKEAAAKLYEAAKNGTQFNIFKGLYKADDIVDTAKAYINKGGVLEPTEALMYRKAVDKLMKSGKIVKDELIAMRQEADAIAKQSDLVAQADPLYVRGLRAEALRNLLPQNKLGGSSAFKTGIAAFTGPLGVLMSPLAQGAAATAAGVGARLASRVAGPTVRSAAGMGSLIGAGLGFGQKRKKE